MIRVPPVSGLSHGLSPPVQTLPMVFTKRLREGVRRGKITRSVRIWTHPHVKLGGTYHIEIDSG